MREYKQINTLVVGILIIEGPQTAKSLYDTITAQYPSGIRGEPIRSVKGLAKILQIFPEVASSGNNGKRYVLRKG